MPSGSDNPRGDGGQMSAEQPTTSAPLLLVEHLAKKFALDLPASRRFAATSIRDELLLRSTDTRPDLRESEFWALDDVSFSLDRGEALGIVGSNGAGKTTLLRLLHGIVAPDWGSVEVRGRTAAVIELGTAFDSYASGRESIYVEGTLLGISRSDLREMEAAIIDFSELGEVIDAPIRTYSSGMRLRLGYAIAAHVHPDLLLLDEVLAVGDVAFQRKCVAYVQQHLAGGGSLVLVSHDLWQIRAVCQRCLVLDEGRVVVDSDTQTSLQEYLQRTAPERAARPGGPTPAHTGAEAPGLAETGPIRVVDCRLVGPDGGAARSRGPAVLEIDLDNDGPATPIRCAAAIGPLDVPVSAIVLDSHDEPLLLESGSTTVRCELGLLALVGSSYAARIGIVDAASDSMLAAVGWEDEPITVVVETPLDEDQSPHHMLGMLGTLDVVWPNREGDG